MSEYYSCPFAVSISSGKCYCSFSVKQCVAEKEIIVCSDNSLHQNCGKLLNYLLTNTKFIFTNKLNLKQQRQIKIGGLVGINNLLFNSLAVTDISVIIKTINTNYGRIDKLPLQQIISYIANFKYKMH